VRAIAAKGKMIAVFATGIDVMYPMQNTRLTEQIVVLGGALITEFPVGTPPTPQNFPIRNRIISGRSAGALVVEATEYSGTRITSRCALEQNRDVYAVPGNVANKSSRRPNTLIKQGAKLVATWEDVWEELPTDSQATLSSQQNESPEPETASLFPDEVSSAHEKRSSGCSKPTNPRRSINGSNSWKTKCRRRKASPRSSSLNGAARWGSCRGRILGRAFELSALSCRLSVKPESLRAESSRS
jgi:predicted Rossmann fold nucleotide-binding protein DprA/Smf involved in DNA uptake